MKNSTSRNILLVSVFLVAGLLGKTSISLAQDYPWTYKNPIPTGRGFTGGAVVDGKIYVIGGFPSHYDVTGVNEMYDPVLDTWTEMDSMPEKRCAHATCTFNGKIFVFGGLHPDPYAYAKNNVYEYDPQSNTWTQKANMPYEIAFPGIALLNDTIYLIGGTTNFYEPPISTVMAYDPVTESWTEKAPLSSPRAFMSACVVDGKIYIFGGADENLLSISYNYVEVYDPATNTWTEKTGMPTSRFVLGTCAMDGKVYGVGGVTDGLVVVTANEMYDPATDTWTGKSPMQEKRHTFFFGSVGNKMYAIGGSYPDSQGNPIIPTSTEEYDPALDTEPTALIVDNIDINSTSFVLYQNYPNPFSLSTIIQYRLTKNAYIKITLYDLTGQELLVLVAENKSAGEYTIPFNTTKLTGGVYYYKMEAKSVNGFSYSETRKLLLVK